MRNNFLYIGIGLLLGVLVPHFQTIFNAAFSANWRLLMSELLVTWQPVVALVPLITIIALILWGMDRRKEWKDEEKAKQRREEAKADLREMIEDIFDRKLSLLNTVLNDGESINHKNPESEDVNQ